MPLDIYNKYTSTSMLLDVDEKKVTQLCGAWFKRRVARYLPENKDARVLDLGCGYGRYMVALQMCGYKNIEGVDISEEQVAYAKEKLGLSRVVLSDALSYLLNKSSQYDCILAFDILEHLDARSLFDVMGAVERALVPGGTIVIQVPNALAPLSPNLFGDITHTTCFTEHSIKQLLGNYRFEHCACHESLPHLHGAISAIRLALWHGCIKPAVSLFMLVSYGNRFGGIFTANLLAVANKKKIL